MIAFVSSMALSNFPKLIGLYPSYTPDPLGVCQVSSPNDGFVGPNNSHADLTTQYMAVDGYAISTTGKQETLLNEGLLRSFPQGELAYMAYPYIQGTQTLIPWVYQKGDLGISPMGFWNAALSSCNSHWQGRCSSRALAGSKQVRAELCQGPQFWTGVSISWNPQICCVPIQIIAC